MARALSTQHPDLREVGLDVAYPVLWAKAGRASLHTATRLEKEAAAALSELAAARKFGAKWDTLHAQLGRQVEALRRVADAAAVVAATRNNVVPDVHLKDLRKRLSDWVGSLSDPESVPAGVQSTDDTLQAALVRAERDAARWERVAVDLERRLSAQSDRWGEERGKLERGRADAERATEKLREDVRVAAGIPGPSVCGSGDCDCDRY